MKKKVCILTNIPAPYRIDLFNHMIDNYKEYEFKIIYSASSEDDRGWALNEDYIINSIFLRGKSISLKGKLDNKHIHIPKDIIKVLNKENPDIIIGSEYNPTCIMAFIWAKIKRIKYISWSDGTLNSEKNINWVQKMLRKIVCRNADTLIASSTKTKEAQIYYGAIESKIYISYLTVDIDKYLYSKNKYVGNRLLFVGRLSYTKGIDLFFKALKEIKSDYLVTIVGEGPEKENLIQLSLELGIEKKIIFVGSKSGNELNEIYRQNDIFVLPSRCDCFGLVLIEAMCNSMAIVSSRYADGAFDLVKSNINGEIIDPYVLESFYDALKKIINDVDLIGKMGNTSYEKVKSYSIKEVSKEFIGAISS